MNLTLEIVSANGQTLGPACRKVFGIEGGRIGRSPDCEWVLANPYISRHHATIRWISGTYYIESTGEDGVAVNSQQAMLPQLERRALKNGDRLFIDEYEIAVGLGNVTPELAQPASGAAPSSGFAPSDDPFADALAPMRSPGALVDSLEPTREELDPLQQLPGRLGGPPVRPSPPEASWNHTPGVSDHFAPPPVPSPAPAIPDDWDRTSFGRAQASAPLAHGSQPSPPNAGGAPAGAIPEDWDKTSFGRGKVTPPPPAAPAPPAPPARVNVSIGMTARPAPPPPAPSGTAPRPSGVPPPRPPAPALRPAVPPSRPASPAQTGGQVAGFDVAALLRSAGVDPAAVPPETAASLGLILRSVVQGVIEVLQARAEVKNQFRLPLTRVKVAENNPLKFAVNAEDALNSLLGRRNSAYLPPLEAFEDAFDDIRFHQMAMLAGLRAGFESVLSRFDPERLQEVFEGQLKHRGLLSMSSKSRYWELYVEEFDDLKAEPDEAFRRLFGEQFAGEYEKHLGVLRRSRSKPRR